MNNVLCRESDINTIKKFAEANNVGNQAFLGVKGVGKTSLLQSYFSRSMRKELAQKYKNLFVLTRLDSRKKGEDLYQFLLDQVRNGIMIIPDASEKESIKEEMAEIDEFFETSDNRLNQYLNTINDHGYKLIAIMDQFHAMSRDNEIGGEQYDILRSLNEQKLITYWVVTDTDLLETCATEQFVSSFFAQKFTSKRTIQPIDENGRQKVTEHFIEEKHADLTEDEVRIVTDLAGGVPQLVPTLIDIVETVKRDVDVTDPEVVCSMALKHDACTSLFEGWITGLNSEQKKILYDVASAGSMSGDEMEVDYAAMAGLADDVGRGLLHVNRDNDERSWTINTGLFRRYIVENRDSFCSDNALQPAGRQGMASQPSGGSAEGTTINNNFYISGDYVQSQTNNVVNIQNAVTGLEDLYKLVHDSPALAGPSVIADKLEALPFHSEEWEELSEEEQEESMDSYADSIFASAVFSEGALSEDQMERFCITDGLLDKMSDDCKKQLICGIQIYDLIQMCIDNFGLDMSESESPRAILFVRAFERHLKDTTNRAIKQIDSLAAQKPHGANKSFRDLPIEKTTIGMYRSLVSSGSRDFAKIFASFPEYEEKDRNWCRDLSNRIDRIGGLRNRCCHGGNDFKTDDLQETIQRVFFDSILDDLTTFKVVGNMDKKRVKELLSGDGAAAAGSPALPKELVGSQVEFTIRSKTDKGDFRGLVNGKYEGILPKEVWDPPLDAVKDTPIVVVVDSIKNGAYRIKLS